jgi:hypothetical protein
MKKRKKELHLRLQAWSAIEAIAVVAKTSDISQRKKKTK